MKTPSDDEQRKFLMLFYETSQTKGLSSIHNIIDAASKSEVREMVIDTIPEFIEITTTGNYRHVVIDDLLRANGLPPFSAFKMMNTRLPNKILKYDRIEDEGDAIVLRDALEAGLVKEDKRQKASLLLTGWL